MYKAHRRLAVVSSGAIVIVLFIALTLLLVPEVQASTLYPVVFATIVAVIVFFVLMIISRHFSKEIDSVIENAAVNSGETAFLSRFIDQMRFCYSLDDFTAAIASVLEAEADCSVLYIDSSRKYILYNSPDRLTNDKSLLERLNMRYPKEWADGCYFLGESFGMVSKAKDARGFLLASEGLHLFVFCRYTRLFDTVIYTRLFEEFRRFQKRSKTISDLSEIAELSKEWELLAHTQQAFLPRTMPMVDRVQFAAVFKPLINVSGDYYTVLPIDERKTLVMLGDVSGKGLAAALVMGLVINTVKILDDKEDLVGMVRAVDEAIKGMHLQDKYTVMFIGIIDTERMTIRYVNASMSDPIIVTKAPDGYRIKKLASNCSIVGIIPIDDIEVAEQRLFRGDLIFMSSDGVSETMSDDNVELGDTEFFTSTIKANGSKTPREFVDAIMELVLQYNGSKRLHDDITMLAAKVS